MNFPVDAIILYNFRNAFCRGNDEVCPFKVESNDFPSYFARSDPWKMGQIVCKVFFPKGMESEHKGNVPMPAVDCAIIAYKPFGIYVDYIRLELVHGVLYKKPLVDSCRPVFLGKCKACGRNPYDAEWKNFVGIFVKKSAFLLFFRVFKAYNAHLMPQF